MIMESPIYKAIEYAYKKNDDGFTFGCYIYDAERHRKRINPRSFSHLNLEDRTSERTKQLIVREALKPMNFPINRAFDLHELCIKNGVNLMKDRDMLYNFKEVMDYIKQYTSFTLINYI